MFNYSTERVMAVTLGTNRETLRKWVWPVVVAIGNLHSMFVSWLTCVTFSFDQALSCKLHVAFSDQMGEQAVK